MCGSKGGEPLFAKGALRVVRCARCGMRFANPVESRFVEGTFYHQLATPFYLSPEKLQGDYAPVRFTRELRLFRRYCRGGALLDVGCSTGGFLHQLQTRFPGEYAVLGADVSGPSLDHAESRGVPVHRGRFLEEDFGTSRFQAVTFWAVLEHLAEPGAFLAKAAALLEPGGHCFVLVPNMESMAVCLLGTRYRYIMEEHLNYFTAATLRRLVDCEPAFQRVLLSTSHFNPVVIWQDWRATNPVARVSDSERAQLLQRTTRWKQNPLLAPARLAYHIAERALVPFRLADNLVMVLRRV